MYDYNSNVSELYSLYQTAVYNGLKERLNASVYVIIEDDSLKVNVKKLGLCWHWVQTGMLERIINSTTSPERLIEAICVDYKHFIFDSFFYKKGVNKV